MISEPQSKRYGVIYADPPWTFSTYSRKGKGSSAEAYYDCMSLEEIKAVRVQEWAARDSVLFLWTTDPLLEQALGVIRAWGFQLQNSRVSLGKAEEIGSARPVYQSELFQRPWVLDESKPRIMFISDAG